MLKILTRFSQSFLEREQEIEQVRDLERKEEEGTGEGRVAGAESGGVCKIVWENSPQEGKRIDCLERRRRRKRKRTIAIWILEEICLVGTEFCRGSRPSCLGKSSTIELPLFDHVTLPGIKDYHLWGKIKWLS